jgi:serine/threonine protein kinase
MIGQVISRYRILAELGSGGMGVVYRAEDLTLHREVGLKVLAAAASSSAVERFLREARAAASLNHPNICTVYDAGEHEGRPYIAMELLKGQSLRALLSNQRLPIADVLDMGAQLADGIAAAHAKGIIHRDIKPANIWVTEDRLIKILDFGLVKLVPELGGDDPAAAETVWQDHVQLTEHAAVVGTISYMSPEQARGEVLDTRTDLFSLGVVLYEMYTGRQPFRGTTSAVVFNAILSHDPQSYADASSIARAPVLERIVSKALVKDRGLRFQQASEMAAELRAARRRLDTDTATFVPAAVVDEHRHDTSQLDRIVGPLDVPEVLRVYLRRFPDADVQHRRLRHYVWPTIGVEDPITGHELLVTQAEQFVRTTLLTDPEAFVLLLGDYGSGKTSFLQMLGRELATDVLMGTPGVPFPIYLSLGFARQTPDLLTALSTHLARHGVPMSPVELGGFIARRRDVVLLLDGFDEMAGWVDYGAIPEILEKIRRLQSVSGVRLVLSGRSSFFRSDVEVGIVGASHVARLRPFNDTNILHYVSLRDPALVARAATLLERHPPLREICRNPIHLMLFTAWLDADEKARQSRSTHARDATAAPSTDASEFSVAGLYQRFFTKTLQDNFGMLTKWPLDQRWAFVRRLAWRWFNDDIVEWPFGEFSKQIRAEFPDLSADEISRYTVQLLNCTFFARTGDRYRFLHRSYLEYLVSQGLADALLAGELEMWEVETPLYTDIFEMVYQILKWRGLERLDLDRVMTTGSYISQVKVLTTAWRHHPPEVEPHVRQQMRHNPHDVVRLMASMGMALYAPTPENVDSLVSAFGDERNSVVRALIQRIANQWRTSAPTADLQRALQSILDSRIDLRTEDAERALLQRMNYSKPEGVLLAFRRAMVQGDQLWPAAVGAILALGVVRHTSSFPHIQKVAAAARHPEIRTAYNLVQPFTGLPALSPA